MNTTSRQHPLHSHSYIFVLYVCDCLQGKVMGSDMTRLLHSQSNAKLNIAGSLAVWYQSRLVFSFMQHTQSLSSRLYARKNHIKNDNMNANQDWHSLPWSDCNITGRLNLSDFLTDWQVNRATPSCLPYATSCLLRFDSFACNTQLGCCRAKNNTVILVK